MKDIAVPKSFPDLVDMTGLDIADDNSKSLEELLEMIVMGRIPDQTHRGFKFWALPSG
jgi:hypothetical protein